MWSSNYPAPGMMLLFLIIAIALLTIRYLLCSVSVVQKAQARDSPVQYFVQMA